MPSSAWQRPSLATRCIAALLAAALASGLLLALSGSRRAPAPGPRTLLLLRLWPVTPPTPVRQEASPTEPRRTPSADAHRRSVAPESIAPPRVEPSPGPEPPLVSTALTPPLAASTPASAPLHLDDRVIRRAIAHTDGAVRRMARESGAELDSPRPGTADRLRSGIADSAVPDCLRPNESASLLSAPLIALQALAGKCK